MTAAPKLPPNDSVTAGGERARRLRAKNLTLLAGLLALVVLIYFIAIVRMGGA